MSKKMAATVCVLTILVFSATPVYAASDCRSTDISVEVTPAYVVTIPENIEVPFNQLETYFGAITLTTAQLEPKNYVKVTVQYDNLLDNTADATKTIPYTIYEGTADATENAFVTASYFSAGDKSDLTIGIAQDDWNKAYGGEYEDTVTFQIEYTDK